MSFNKIQQIVLVVVGAIVLGMLLFPPFDQKLPSGARVSTGYAFIMKPPRLNENVKYPSTLNTGQLAVQWLGTLILGGIALVLTSNNNSPKSLTKSNEIVHEADSCIKTSVIHESDINDCKPVINSNKQTFDYKKIYYFRNDSKNKCVKITNPFWLVLIFGPAYFMFNKMYGQAFLNMILLFPTYGIINLFFALFAFKMVVVHYEKTGWRQIRESEYVDQDKDYDKFIKEQGY